VPLGSFATWTSATLSLFSSAKAKPTQPSDVGESAMPWMMVLSFGLAM
jgi:hypothetical protein